MTLNTRNYVRSVIAPSTEPETELTESVRYPSTILYSTYRPEESNALSAQIDARGVARGEEDFVSLCRLAAALGGLIKDCEIQAQSKSKQSVVRQ